MSCPERLVRRSPRHREICGQHHLGLLLTLTATIAAAGCAGISQTVSPTQELLVGKTRQEILACAGTPLNTIQQGDVTVLSYYKECPVIERSFFGTKGSVPMRRHGCRALVTLEGDRVTEVRYEPTAGGGIDHCEEVFVQCVQ